MTALVISATFWVSGCATKNSDSSHAVASSTAGYIASQAEGLARSMGIKNPPKVELVRFVSPEEWGQVQVDCLRKAGFQVKLTTDGEGVSFPPFLDESLVDQENLASYKCQVEYLPAPKYNAPLTKGQLHRLYKYRSSQLVRCLGRLGHTPSARPPSESAFIESGGAWSPYSSAAIPDSDLRRTTRTCPQDPSDLYG